MAINGQPLDEHSHKRHSAKACGRDWNPHGSTITGGNRMESFLAAMIGWPTAVFTIGLGVCLLYWALVIFGALDFDLFGHGHDAGDLGHASHDGLGEAGHHLGFWHGFLEFLAVGTVPITIVLTLFLLAAWTVSMLGALFLAPLVSGLIPAWLTGTLLLPVAFIAAVPAARLGIWPLKLIFRNLTSGGHASRRDAIGKVARITSQTADGDFGTAVCLVDGAEHLLNVVARPGSAFRKGDQVVVVSYDDAKDRFLVGALPHLVTADGLEAGNAAGPAPSSLAAPPASRPQPSSRIPS